jgi:archaetidylinositol phosphate synthase
MIGRALKSSVLWIGRTSLAALLKTRLSANQVTFIGLLLVLGNSIAYVFHQDTFFFGLCLSLSYAFDGVDGLVARKTGTSSRFGSYLDAVIDRYQEIISYSVLGFVNGWWIPVFLLTTGAMLVSYNKAAVSIETPIQNKDWPDLMERPKRAWFFCAALMLDNTIPVPEAWGGRFIVLGMYFLAALTHFTAIQRFLRARRRLLAQG